jgi:hypothetical protein
MCLKATSLGLFATVLAASFAAAPAMAACRDNAGRVVRCYDVQEFAAQGRPRITVHPRRNFPGPNAKRYCRAWLATENRPSGTVITPQMVCWWQ